MIKRVVGLCLITIIGLAACTNATSSGPEESASPVASPSSSSPEPEPSQTPTPAPTPTPTPTGPVELTVEEAGAIYLEQACNVTKIERKYQDVRERNDAYTGSDVAPSAKTKKAAQKAADANEAMALALADPNVIWPQGIRKDIKNVAAWEYEIAAHYLDVVEADSWADVGPYPSLKNGDAPATIRLALSLPPPGQCD